MSHNDVTVRFDWGAVWAVVGVLAIVCGLSALALRGWEPFLLGFGIFNGCNMLAKYRMGELTDG